MNFGLFDVNLSSEETEYLNRNIRDNEFECSDYKCIRNLLRHLRLKNIFGRINTSLKKTNKHLNRAKTNFENFGA